MNFVRIQSHPIDAVVLLPFMVRHSLWFGAPVLSQAAMMTFS